MVTGENLQLGFFDSAESDASVESSPLAPRLAGLEALGAVHGITIDRPARGRSAQRARTAVLYSRLQELGLRDVDRLVLTRTRTVMVSLIGRSLRIHEGYTEAPESVLRAVVAFAQAPSKAQRTQARSVILSFDVGASPARRKEQARPGDVALIAQLTSAHRELNERWFGGELKQIALGLSSRMATRLGHFDPGTRHTPSEIVLSRRHIIRDGWREAMQTLLHEMIHQWQHETGQAVDHGAAFRRKAREIGVVAAAKRPVNQVANKRFGFMR